MARISLVGKNDRKIYHIAKGLYRTIISGKETAGSYAVIEMVVPPGGGPGPHAHPDIEEVFYVAVGEVDFYTEDGMQQAKAGDTIRIPTGGAVHAFKNTSESDATLICTVFPAGLDDMFAEINASDPSAVKEIGEKYGNQFFPADFFGRWLDNIPAPGTPSDVRLRTWYARFRRFVEDIPFSDAGIRIVL